MRLNRWQRVVLVVAFVGIAVPCVAFYFESDTADNLPELIAVFVTVAGLAVGWIELLGADKPDDKQKDNESEDVSR